MRKTILVVLIVVPAAFLTGCVTQRVNSLGYNTDYGYAGKIYPGRISNVSYGLDFGSGYGLNHGVNDYAFSPAIDDYGLGYGIVDYGEPVNGGRYYRQSWVNTTSEDGTSLLHVSSSRRVHVSSSRRVHVTSSKVHLTGSRWHTGGRVWHSGVR